MSILIESVLLTAALAYADLGYAVFPCLSNGKIPITKHGFLDSSTDHAVIVNWWSASPSANIGLHTKGLCAIDVDKLDGADNPWPGDPDKLYDLSSGAVSRTPRGGRHYVFREPEGKHWKTSVGKIAPKVDTRCSDGYIVVPPSAIHGKPYCWVEKSELQRSRQHLAEPPAWLIEILDGLDVDVGSNGKSRTSAVIGGNIIPSGQRNDTLARLGGSMRRVGMGPDEILGALTETNRTRCDPPLPASEVDHVVKSICKYEPDQIAVATVENHWGQMTEEEEAAKEKEVEKARDPRDPGLIPYELLRVPGFVSEVMDHCLQYAPYPNVVMAFCGALSLQAHLAARKIKDPGNNRTNIYLLGLAYSSAGKDHPRRLNANILHHIGMSKGLANRFASGEGIEDSLQGTPSMLFQTDEIDGMLQSLSRSRDARHENIMGTLLTMYSSASGLFPMRRKAGKDEPGIIDQPCLSLFGTAIPNHYYEALSDRMLTNGFFARMLILEGAKRGGGQEPSEKFEQIPERILETAKWWADFKPGPGDLESWHPVPSVIEHEDAAKDVLVQTRKEAEEEYNKAENLGDPVGTTVWGRVSEHTRKLALLYAVSGTRLGLPVISKAATEWASAFVFHLTRRMLFMAQGHVSDNPFHADCLKLMQRLRDSPGWKMTHSDLLRRMKTDKDRFAKLIETLIQQGDLESLLEKTKGRPKLIYRIAGGERRVKEVKEVPN